MTKAVNAIHGEILWRLKDRQLPVDCKFHKSPFAIKHKEEPLAMGEFIWLPDPMLVWEIEYNEHHLIIELHKLLYPDAPHTYQIEAMRRLGYGDPNLFDMVVSFIVESRVNYAETD